MGLDFIISYSENNMLFILLVKTHHFGWLKPIILATASPSPPWATRWQHGHQGYGPGPLLSFFFGFRTLRTTSCIYQICVYVYIYMLLCIYYIAYTFFKNTKSLCSCLTVSVKIHAWFHLFWRSWAPAFRRSVPLSHFKLSLERVGTVGTIPERSEDHLPNMDYIQTLQKGQNHI